MSIVRTIEKKPGVEGADLMIFCPACKCGHGIWLETANSLGGRWKWNGSMEKPTFQPSLKITRRVHEPPVTPENLEEYKKNPWPQTQRDYICHSVITDGMIAFCEDCTHELVGKTVPLEDF